jgi:hypothetical protein
VRGRIDRLEERLPAIPLNAPPVEDTVVPRGTPASPQDRGDLSVEVWHIHFDQKRRHLCGGPFEPQVAARVHEVDQRLLSGECDPVELVVATVRLESGEHVAKRESETIPRLLIVEERPEPVPRPLEVRVGPDGPEEPVDRRRRPRLEEQEASR